MANHPASPTAGEAEFWAGVAAAWELAAGGQPIDDRDAFFTMELVCGAPLTEFAREAGSLVLRGVLARIAEAVGELHARGQIHRDLKPANILSTTHPRHGRVIAPSRDDAQDELAADRRVTER